MSSGIALMAMMIAASLAVAIYIAWPLLVGKPNEDPQDTEDEASQVLDELLIQKDATYSAIKELEFDHATGNLSKQDYRELASRYEDKAVALLKTIDEVSRVTPGRGLTAPAVAGVMLGPAREGGIGDPIEQQVAALRRARGKAGRRGGTAAVDEEIEGEIARLRAKRQVTHVASGDVAEAVEQQVAALRASRAGGPVLPSVAPRSAPLVRTTCPACGQLLRSASAAFCSRCGAALATQCPVCGAMAEAGDAFCSACGTSLASREAAEAGQTILGGANV